jgi:hypothetical protein
MRTIRSFIFPGSCVTIHDTDIGWVALAIGDDGMPMASKPISREEAALALGRYEHTIIEHS